MRTIEVELEPDGATVSLDVGGERGRRRRAFRAGGPWGLSRWVDPADGAAYVVFSGALGGSADLLGDAGGPDDLMPTTLRVRDGSPGALIVVPPAGGVLAGHQLGFASGPFASVAGDGVVLHRRRSSAVSLSGTLAETRAALDWMLDFFGGAAPWGDDYVQVLVPRAPWLAMEHPGCVLLSERLLGLEQPRRLAVLAHEAAHQWLGNLVSPATWPDVGVFEGLAELLGQLACRDLLGLAAEGYLARRRRVVPLAAIPGRDPRREPATAGLAEVAGPVPHAELLRAVRDLVSATTFRDRIRDLVRDRAGRATGAAQVWAVLGVAAREPERTVLPAARPPTGAGVAWGPVRGAVEALLEAPADEDPATAVLRARGAFRASAPGSGRLAEALALVGDPAVPGPVAVGLAAELTRG